jgi:hypothetical protein
MIRNKLRITAGVFKDRGEFIGLMLIIAIVCFIRISLLNVPLERDEGEFAYMGQVILQGIPPYQHAYSMKFPGIYVMYALIMRLFGQSPAGIHLGLLVVNAGTIVLIFLLGRRLFSAVAGTAAAASYAVLSVSQSVLGVFAHATQFAALFGTAGIFLLSSPRSRTRASKLFLCGLCFGLSFTMKQHAAFYAVFGFLYVLWQERHSQRGDLRTLAGRLLSFLSGAALPLAIIAGWLSLEGVFAKFWFWTFEYARAYASELSLVDGMNIFRQRVVSLTRTTHALWLMAGLGIPAILLDRRIRDHSVLILGFAFFSFLAVTPGFFFREHYFVLMLPALSLLIGAAVVSGERLLAKHGASTLSHVIPAIIVIAAIGHTLYQERVFLIGANPMRVSRAVYGPNPFPESVAIASYIKNHTGENEKIAVFGSEPEIYFYAHRPSATGHIYMYGLMEDQKYALQMQQEMIREVESQSPAFIVFVNVSTSWLAGPRSEKMIFDWMRTYLADHYERVGIADIIRKDLTIYRWEDRAKNYSPVSRYNVYVFRRK